MGFILWVWGWGSMIYDPRVIYYCCVRVFEKLFEVEFRNLCFWRNGIMFRTKCGCGAPENENTPHFREIPSVAPEVFHCVRVGGRTIISSTCDLPGNPLSYSDPLSLFSSTCWVFGDCLNLSSSLRFSYKWLLPHLFMLQVVFDSSDFRAWEYWYFDQSNKRLHYLDVTTLF